MFGLLLFVEDESCEFGNRKITSVLGDGVTGHRGAGAPKIWLRVIVLSDV